ncbi:PREDICTED: uncharacterized protein LOC108768503 [Trachymyrmex cornetzi]|uniref:uncharacterized protein LOC108768503 n=1 Tax=Trachymyrmex cornetzi TaxID=471704 RepID=UPI00084F31A1|nr:PREDICTED: uncharacterized protein LOC108768503 [Trachymyrmex cornetzi]
MTTKMAYYFIWIIIDLRELFNTIIIDNYEKSKIMAIIITSFYLSHHIFKFLLFNYMCETVSIKANATANLLNRLSCTTCDVEIREIISQFLLRIIHTPLRFCGIGLFQFGFKFLHKFITSLVTVLVIIIQAQANK